MKLYKILVLLSILLVAGHCTVHAAINNAYTLWSQFRGKKIVAASCVALAGAVPCTLWYPGDKKPAYIIAAGAALVMCASWYKFARFYQEAADNDNVSFPKALMRTAPYLLLEPKRNSVQQDTPIKLRVGTQQQYYGLHPSNFSGSALREVDLKGDVYSLHVNTIGYIQVIKGNKNYLTVHAPSEILSSVLKEQYTSGELRLSAPGIKAFTSLKRTSPGIVRGDVQYTLTLVNPEKLTFVGNNHTADCCVDSMGNKGENVVVRHNGTGRLYVGLISGKAVQVECYGCGTVGIESIKASSVTCVVVGRALVKCDVALSEGIEIELYGAVHCTVKGSCKELSCNCTPDLYKEQPVCDLSALILNSPSA